MSTGTRVSELSLSIQSESGGAIPASLVTRCTSIRDYKVSVPSGKTVLQVLDPRVIVSTAEPMFVLLKSNRNGVTYWAPDEAAPAVDPDTMELGWLTKFDDGASFWEHVHGASSYADHDAATTVKLYEALPAWSTVYEDRLAGYRLAMREMNPPATALSRPGSVGGYGATADAESMCWKSLARAYGVDPTGNERVASFVMYYLGMANYLNLGAPTDGLRIYSHIHASDADEGAAIVSMQFFNYPFFQAMTDPALVPATNPAGETVWAANDRNLCLRGIGGSGLGWSFDHSIPSLDGGVAAKNSASFFFGSPFNWVDNDFEDGPKAAGWSVHGRGYESSGLDKGAKSAFALGPANPAATGNLFPSYATQAPTWNRVTAMMMGFCGFKATALGALRHLGLSIGPKGGGGAGATELRGAPEILTSKPWSVSSTPAIALQNYTGADAEVHIVYGTSR